MKARLGVVKTHWTGGMSGRDPDSFAGHERYSPPGTNCICTVQCVGDCTR